MWHRLKPALYLALLAPLIAEALLGSVMLLGGLLACGWLGFFPTVRVHGADSIPGQFFPFTIVMALAYGRFLRRPRTGETRK